MNPHRAHAHAAPADTVRAPGPPSGICSFPEEEVGSGVHRIVSPASPASDQHLLVFSEIQVEWLSPANDAGAADLTQTALIFDALGSLEHIPHIVSAEEATWWAESDHVTAFLLDLVDGETTLNAIADATPLPFMDVLGSLARLVHEGVLRLS